MHFQHLPKIGANTVRSQLERVKHERELWKEVVERRQQQPLQCLGLQHVVDVKRPDSFGVSERWCH